MKPEDWRTVGAISGVAALACRREFRPHLAAALPALGAEELRLDVREPDVVSPAVSIDLDGMAAVVVAAIDQHIAGAGRAHFAEGDRSWIGSHREIPV